ncbi:MAG: chorismate mutase [Anaerovoracaceae bacterium]|jgi:chorismate mutase
MDNKGKLEELRKELDNIDDKILFYFGKRMEIIDQISSIKKEGNIALTDKEREELIINRALSVTHPKLKDETILFMRSLISISKLRQIKLHKE